MKRSNYKLYVSYMDFLKNEPDYKPTELTEEEFDGLIDRIINGTRSEYRASINKLKKWVYSKYWYDLDTVRDKRVNNLLFNMNVDVEPISMVDFEDIIVKSINRDEMEFNRNMSSGYYD